MSFGNINITIDLSYWYALLDTGNPLFIALKLLKDGGWYLFFFLFFLAVWRLWVNSRQNMFDAKRVPVVLALDIPKDNEQSPKAVEHIFSHLWAIFSGGSLIDKYWEGRFQESMSFEIVGDGGYIQFYIRTFEHFRDMVEAAVYAQYPNAIITEVEDYAFKFKKLRFPNKEYKMWGTEMKLMKKNAYPIKTYEAFEHSLSQELKDPMASVLELLGRLKPREHLWLQFVVTPISGSWGEAGEKIVKKMLGMDVGDGKKGIVYKVGDLPVQFLALLGKHVFNNSAADSSTKKDDSPMMQKITPGEVEIIKAIQNKASKASFNTNFRIVYLSPPPVYSKHRGIVGILGALNQFNTVNLNALIKDKKRDSSAIDYFFVDTRKNWRRSLILKKYISRSNEGTKFILNTEELASLYHFPVMEVKPTLLSTVEAKRVEPPTYLPSDNLPVSMEETIIPEKISELISQPEPSSEFEDIGEGIPWDLLDDIDQKGENEQNENIVKTEMETKEVSTTDDNIQNVLNKEQEDVTSDELVIKSDNNKSEEKSSKLQNNIPDNLPFVK